MDQLEEGKLLLPVSQKKSELTGRYRWNLQRELVLPPDKLQTIPSQHNAAKSDGVTGVLLHPVLASYLPL